MQQPPGFETPQNTNMVCKLHKVLYGLKQAPRACFDKLYGALMRFVFTSIKSDQSLYVIINPGCTIYFLIYVEDILITGNNFTVHSIWSELNLINLSMSFNFTEAF